MEDWVLPQPTSSLHKWIYIIRHVLLTVTLLGTVSGWGQGFGMSEEQGGGA